VQAAAVATLSQLAAAHQSHEAQAGDTGDNKNRTSQRLPLAGLMDFRELQRGLAMMPPATEPRSFFRPFPG